jgi:hypothetical protein
MRVDGSRAERERSLRINIKIFRPIISKGKHHFVSNASDITGYRGWEGSGDYRASSLRYTVIICPTVGNTQVSPNRVRDQPTE